MVGEKSIHVRCSGSNNKTVTVLLCIMADGTKLPPFIVFKGTPHGKIEKSLDTLLPEGMVGCCQEVGWIDEQNSALWISKVWRPYVQDVNDSFLLLDCFKCHQQACFTDKLSDCGTEYEFIPGGYTSQLQPCDVGINKPFKTYMRQLYMNWCVEKYRELGSIIGALPTPGRREIIEWVRLSWENISPAIVRNAWRACGYRILLNENEDKDEPALYYDEDIGDGDCELSYTEALKRMEQFTLL